MYQEDYNQLLTRIFLHEGGSINQVSFYKVRDHIENFIEDSTIYNELNIRQSLPRRITTDIWKEDHFLYSGRGRTMMDGLGRFQYLHKEAAKRSEKETKGYIFNELDYQASEKREDWVPLLEELEKMHIHTGRKPWQEDSKIDSYTQIYKKIFLKIFGNQLNKLRYSYVANSTPYSGLQIYKLSIVEGEEANIYEDYKNYIEKDHTYTTWLVFTENSDMNYQYSATYVHVAYSEELSKMHKLLRYDSFLCPLGHFDRVEDRRLIGNRW